MSTPSTVTPRSGPATNTEPSQATPAHGRVEVGWLVVGRVDEIDRRAIRAARDALRDEISRALPAYAWRMPLVERLDVPLPLRQESSSLLDAGVSERDSRRWDYVFVVTGTDLLSDRAPHAMAASSRSLSVGVLSTAQIDPSAAGVEVDEEERQRVIAHRLGALARHVLGELAGLEHESDPSSAMYPHHTLEGLDAVDGFSGPSIAELADTLRDVADLRLEEQARRPSRLAFYLQALWINRSEVGRALVRARPWLFPLRLSRLTTAAVATLLLLVNTAEAWEVAVSQTPRTVAGVSGLAIVLTIWFVIRRQRLFLGDVRHRRSEQAVVTHASVILVVGTGMLITYLLLFGLTLALTLVFFPESVIQTWTPSLQGSPTLRHYLRMSGFLAFLGLVIGALGASFEEQHHVRNVAYIDEEL